MLFNDERKACGADVSANWQIILNTVYRHREKIPLLLKAGMGMEILRQINRSIDGVNEEYRLRLMAWNGVIFNSILWWAQRNFADDPEALSRQLTEITEPLLTVQYTAFPAGEKTNCIRNEKPAIAAGFYRFSLC